MTEVVNIRAEKDDLRRAIVRYADVSCLSDRQGAWQAVEGAILGLDNAAYDRAYTKAQEEHPTTLQVSLELVNARTKSLRLMQELETVRRLRVHAEKDHAELQRQFDERGRERDQLKLERDASRTECARMDVAWRDVNSGRHREIERLQAELADARGTIRELGTQVVRLEEELADAREKIQSQSMCLARVNEAHARTFSRESRVAERWRTEAFSLRKALETLADRYHAQCCWRKPRHQRQTCSQPPQAVKDAEKALAGESGLKIGSDTELFHGVVDHVATSDRMLTSEEVKAAHRILFDDRKPPEQPEIEAVLMCSEIVCACGCGATMERGQAAYRFVRREPAHRPLYASEACARKEAAKPPEASTTPEPESVYECTNHLLDPYDPGWPTPPCGWTGGVRDLSPMGRCPMCWHKVRIVEKLP